MDPRGAGSLPESQVIQQKMKNNNTDLGGGPESVCAPVKLQGDGHSSTTAARTPWGSCYKKGLGHLGKGKAISASWEDSPAGRISLAWTRDQRCQHQENSFHSSPRKNFCLSRAVPMNWVAFVGNGLLSLG